MKFKDLQNSVMHTSCLIKWQGGLGNFSECETWQRDVSLVVRDDGRLGLIKRTSATSRFCGNSDLDQSFGGLFVDLPVLKWS